MIWINAQNNFLCATILREKLSVVGNMSVTQNVTISECILFASKGRFVR
jgi:hypothetical protein